MFRQCQNPDNFIHMIASAYAYNPPPAYLLVWALCKCNSVWVPNCSAES